MHIVYADRHPEPNAFDLWEHAVEHFMPAGPARAASAKRTFFGGRYQKLVPTRWAVQ